MNINVLKVQEQIELLLTQHILVDTFVMNVEQIQEVEKYFLGHVEVVNMIYAQIVILTIYYLPKTISLKIVKS